MFDTILLILLGVFSLRDLISQNISIPKHKKWSWLFYNRKDLYDIPYCYQLSKKAEEKEMLNASSKDIISKLLAVLGKHTTFFQEKIYYSRMRKEMTEYFINTHEAVHDSSDALIMCDALRRLFIACQEEKKCEFDFVISLKNGNSHLVHKLCDQYLDDLIHVSYHTKNEWYSPVAPSNSSDNSNGRRLQFENIKALFEAAESSSEPLTGIILDCSFSSGKGLLSCIDDFNNMLKDEKDKNILPIQNCCVLYSHIDNDIRDQAKERGCDLSYYFTLNEAIRKEIYDEITKKDSRAEKEQGIADVIKNMKEQHLIIQE